MTTTVQISQCRHIKINGVRCGSPALRGQPHCYFHKYQRNPRPQVPPLLEDRPSIHHAVLDVMRGIAHNTWDRRTAHLMLWALQIASTNAKDIDFQPPPELVVRELPE